MALADILDRIDVQIVALLFNIAMIIVYFSKKRINNIESKKYSFLLCMVFICICLDIVASLSNVFFSSNAFISYITKAIYYYALILSINIILMYSIILINSDYHKTKIFLKSLDADYKKRNEKKRDNSIKTFTALSYSISVIELYFILMLPYNDVVLFGLPSIKVFIYGAFLIRVIVLSILLCLRWKYVSSPTKHVIFTIILGFIIYTILQVFVFKNITATIMLTITLVIMYFTVQNPDYEIIKELTEAKRKAEDVNEGKTNFLLSMSHEIRTPLNSIVGFSEILKENNKDPEINDGVNSILVASNSLLDTINGILDISKIESNILEIKTNSYSFKKLFDELCLLGKSRINGKNIEFRSWADPYIPEYLIGDFIHVKQVVLNILTNAIKYTKEGYVDFKINTKLSDKYCTLIISVEDTGIGIKKEDLNRLFTKFDRLGVERQMQIEGTGLGLALTKRLVDLMNGKISVTSEYGKGSTFTVELIQGINTNAIKPVKEEIKVSSLNLFKGKNVLVVDDNVTGLKVITKFLNKYGINVITLRSGEEAIKYAIFGNKTDLIFMDDVMPSLSGTETLKKLKKINGFNVPVVMLTANVITGMREKYLEQGFDEYLAKPINVEELDEILIKFLR